MSDRRSPIVRAVALAGRPVVPGAAQDARPVVGESVTAAGPAAVRESVRGVVAVEPEPAPTPEQTYSEARDAGYRDGHAQGLAAGERDGLKRAEQRLAEALEQAKALQADFERQLRDAYAARAQALAEALGKAEAGVVERLEPELVAIAFEAIGELVGEQLASAEGVAARVRGLLSRARAVPLRVVLAPRAVEALRSHAAWQAIVDAHAGLELRSDPALADGDCRVETSGESLEARLADQFDRLARAWGQATPERAATSALSAAERRGG